MSRVNHSNLFKRILNGILWAMRIPYAVKCPYCGNRVLVKCNFCHYCGKRLHHSTPVKIEQAITKHHYARNLIHQ